MGAVSGNGPVLATRLGQFAARARVGEVLDNDADHLVLAALCLAQIDVLRDVLRRRHGYRPARRFDFGSAQRLVEVGFVLDVALGGRQTNGEELRRVVALHGVDVGIAVENLADPGTGCKWA